MKSSNFSLLPWGLGCSLHEWCMMCILAQNKDLGSTVKLVLARHHATIAAAIQYERAPFGSSLHLPTFLVRCASSSLHQL